MSAVELLRAERHFRLTLLNNRLDIAKARSILHRSVDVQAANARDGTFLNFFHQGKKVLFNALGSGLLLTTLAAGAARRPHAGVDGITSRAANTLDVADASTADDATEHVSIAAFGLPKRSIFLDSALKACIVDDVNLAAAFEALRLEELLEGCYQAPPVSLCAALVLAILGELHTVRQTLLSVGCPEAGLTVKFLERTLEQFTSFLIETGRDRYTYIKESLVSSILTPPRPFLPQTPVQGALSDDIPLIRDVFTLSALLEEEFDREAPLCEGDRSTLSELYNRGDTQLEVLLASGSVLSLLRRLRLLQLRHGPCAADMIRFAVIRQAPLLSRLRQLAFTRVMHVLACPLGKSPFDERARAAVRGVLGLNASRTTLQLLARSLLGCGVATWCYETDEARTAICYEGLPPNCGQRLSQLLCVKVSRSLIDAVRTCKIPDANVLSKQFLEFSGAVSKSSQYSQLFFSQHRPKPPYTSVDVEGGPETNDNVCSLIASSLQCATPDFFTTGAVDDVKFFANPLSTALKHRRGFEQTLKGFFAIKDVEDEPGIRSALREHDLCPKLFDMQ